MGGLGGSIHRVGAAALSVYSDHPGLFFVFCLGGLFDSDDSPRKTHLL
jgi:hypothetical protein